jgi:hypothetical protein
MAAARANIPTTLEDESSRARCADAYFGVASRRSNGGCEPSAVIQKTRSARRTIASGEPDGAAIRRGADNAADRARDSRSSGAGLKDSPHWATPDYLRGCIDELQQCGYCSAINAACHTRIPGRPCRSSFGQTRQSPDRTSAAPLASPSGRAYTLATFHVSMVTDPASVVVLRDGSWCVNTT